MDLLEFLLFSSIFLFAATLVELFYLIWVKSNFTEKWAIRRRLLYLSAGGRHGGEKLSLYKKKTLQEAGTLTSLLYQLPRLRGLDRMLLNARVPLNASGFFLVSLCAGTATLFVGMALLPTTAGALVLAFAAASLPLALLRQAERKTLHKFEEQFPEAMDLLSRSLRSGHAISAGMEIVAQDMSEPLRSEFSATLEEINLGLSLKEAMENMCERVASPDLRFFTIALLIQRETGGNLVEVLENISRLIRERTQFRRQVKALTAEGRLSAIILLLLPVALFVYLYLLRYEYISLLWTEQIGIYMMAAGILAQVVGAVVMKRIVTIEI
jgi:tight adherence protein B